MKKLASALSILLCVLFLICSCSDIGTQNTATLHSPEDSGYIPRYSTLEPSTLSTEPASNTEVSTSPDETPASTPETSETPAVVTPDPTPTAPPTPSTPTYIDLPKPGFITEQAFVYDVNRGCFLYLSGEETPIYPASTTKLLTILYARTLLPLDLVVTPGNELEMVGENSSLAYIRADSGHKLTVEQLIEGMLLPSGNDAAHVLAAAGGKALDPSITDGKEAVARFMEGMNRYAKQLGLVGSNFVTPDGYDRDGHITTLEDMAIVAREAYKDPIIRKYSATVVDEVIYASGHRMTWKNTNQLINPDSAYYAPEVNGLKTGTKETNVYYCLIASAEIEGDAYLFGFYGSSESKDRFLDTITAINWIKTYLY